MKKFNEYIVLIVSTICILTGCSTNEESQVVFGKNELPKIYMVSWQTNQSVLIGKAIVFSPSVSPSDGATYKWTLDGVVISTEKNLNYIVTNAPGSYNFRFDVERNGQTTYRTAIIKVML